MGACTTQVLRRQSGDRVIHLGRGATAHRGGQQDRSCDPGPDGSRQAAGASGAIVAIGDVHKSIAGAAARSHPTPQQTGRRCWAHLAIQVRNSANTLTA